MNDFFAWRCRNDDSLPCPPEGCSRQDGCARENTKGPYVHTARLLVTGSREWKDAVRLEDALTEIRFELLHNGADNVVLVHGKAANGADLLADNWGRGLDITVEPHPAEWRRDGAFIKSAGFQRNKLMVDLGADVCVAFLTPGCKGTVHCAALAQHAGIPVRAFFES